MYLFCLWEYKKKFKTQEVQWCTLKRTWRREGIKVNFVEGLNKTPQKYEWKKQMRKSISFLN